MKKKTDHSTEEKPSKTQRKKAMIALQKLGEQLVNLPDSQLQKIPLDKELLAEIQFARGLKTHESKRRHLQYIGKLMRAQDAEPIMAALKKITVHDEQYTAAFHQIEQWRERFILEGDAALQPFLQSYPETDKQKLQQLIRKVRADHAQHKNSGAKTELFRFLREVIKL